MNELTTKDFELEQPSSLRNFIEETMYASLDDDLRQGKKVEPITDEVIDELMPKVYKWIEKKALATYHSNEPWALRQWALSNILKEEVISETTVEIAHGLITDVIGWQKEQEFDPLIHFQKQISGLSPKTQKGYLITASRFVGYIGRKNYYSDEDVINYLNYARKIYNNDNTYQQEGIRLLQFLRSLGDENRRLPGTRKRRKVRKKYTYALPVEDMETIIWACVLDSIRYDMVIRLIGATVYGRRVGELVDFKINHNTVEFPTRKGGEEVPHPIPESLIPLFKVPIHPISEYCLQRWLRQICRKAGVDLPYRGGFHSFRRTVATLVKHSIRSDIDTHKFMRWAEPRELGILAQYDQTRYEDVDKLVLDSHPMVRVWEEVLPYILKYNRSYKPFYDNAH